MTNKLDFSKELVGRRALVTHLPGPGRGTDHGPFLRDLVVALAVRRHAISPKYFYGAAGSHLFDRICAATSSKFSKEELYGSRILGRYFGYAESRWLA